MKIMFIVLAICAVIFSSVQQAPAQEALMIQKTTTILLDEAERPEVFHAALHLVRDLEAVTDSTVRLKTITDALPDANPNEQLIVISHRGGTTESFRKTSSGDWTPGYENYRIRLLRKTGGDANSVILIQGADMRGTLYGIYAFSEHALGIPPLHHWASWKPEPKDSFDPRGLNITAKSPSMKYRAWFPNDQDYLTRWRGAVTQSDEIIIETMLRLRLNLLDVGNLLNHAFELDALSREAVKRGLILTSTHTVPLGIRIEEKRWKKYWGEIRKMPVPEYDRIANIDKIREYWKYGVEVLKKSGAEVLWTATFRGNGDRPFWTMYKDAPSGAKERARIIESMIQWQVNHLRSELQDPTIRVPLYHEMSEFFLGRLMALPRGEDVI